jgi:superfamily II DNA or RNA helicase
VAAALGFVESGRVTLRVVEELRVEAEVRDPRYSAPAVALVEWGGGTGPLALRPVCTCGASGVCAHAIATLEAVRSQTEFTARAPDDDLDLSWLPSPRSVGSGRRARSVWVVFSIVDGAVGATFVLDSPRLRGAMRDAAAILTMMDSSPADDWDDADRELLRDEAVYDAFNGRTPAKALGRAMLALARHPRVRFDADPPLGRHPSELPDFAVDLRGVRLRATRRSGTFIPLVVNADARRVAIAEAAVVPGPPQWLVTRRSAYLLDGSFDPHRAIEASRQTNGVASSTAGAKAAFSLRTIERVAPYLLRDERAQLGIVDAAQPSAEAAFSWNAGALVAVLTFIDRAGGARAPYDSFGAIAREGTGFTRFTAEHAHSLRHRMIEAGFVPRGVDAFALHGADRAAAFVRETLPTWSDLDRRLDPGLVDLAAGSAQLDVSVSAVRRLPDADWFELNVDATLPGGETLTAAELEALLASSGKYADVRGKLLDVERFRARSILVADLTERKRTGLAALLALRDELHENFDRVDLPPEVEALRERLREFAGIEHVMPPPLQAGKLRHYQEIGLDFLSYLASFSFGGILADEMGLGKTIQVISHLLYRKSGEGPAPSLVIAPTSVTHTWENEIKRFAPELSTLRLQSGSERAARYDDIATADVVITSYAIARIDAEQLAQHRFRTLILDEAQNAKNPSSQIARVVRSLSADHRIALTGTPVENSLRDLWAIFAFAEPGLLGTESAFRRRFELPIADGDPHATGALRARLEPFVLRRTKEDVAPELPERTEVVLECDLSPLQRRLYRGVAEAARRDLFPLVDAQGIERTTVHVLAALTRLRQICAHPGMLFEEHRNDPDASAKFESFLETVEEILSGEHRVLIFSAFASMLKIMRAELDRRGIGYGYLDGSTKDRDRNAEVERFMQPDGPPVFLCSLKAGGVGLTLTAADYVILYDPWWNPAVERQAIDRTHRIGQQRNVTAYRLVTSGTVEEKIRVLAERKADLSRAVIKADGAIAKSLTREDLEMLLADPE